MIKHFSSLCSFYRAPLLCSSLSSLIINPLFLRRGRHYFLCICLSVWHVIPGHWGTGIRAKREGGIRPYRTRYVSKGRAHAHITRLCNGAISGHFIIISEHFVITLGYCIISPGLFGMASISYYVGLTLGRVLSGGYMMRLAGRGVVDPVYSAIRQRCFHNTYKTWVYTLNCCKIQVPMYRLS